MKLATLKDGTRDGRLAVVSRDLTRFTDASFLARTLQAALDDWRRVSPHLAALAESLEIGSVPSSRFHEHDAHSPLPRACRAGAALLAPRDPIRVADEAWGIDCRAEAAVVVDDLPPGAGMDEAREAIRLVMLVNDVALRALAGPGPAGGFQSRPFSAFSPVAVTPDELGDAWNDGTARLSLAVDLNGKPSGRAKAGEAYDFPALVAQAARTRPLSAGTTVGRGPELTEAGPSLRFGDTLRVEMKDKTGHSVFGAIEQTVEKYTR